MYHQSAQTEESIELYERYSPAVFAYLMRQVGVREDAEDLLLEIFLAVVEKGQEFSQDEQLVRAFIWSVARNKVVDHYRRFKRRRSVPLVDVEETIYEHEDREPERVALRREEYAQIQQLMKNLPDTQREVVQLRFGHELSYSEIAQIVSKSESAVRMILHRALNLLRKAYSGTQIERSK